MVRLWSCLRCGRISLARLKEMAVAADDWFLRENIHKLKR